MSTTTLRKSGGSHIVTVPNAFVEQNRLKAGATLELTISGDALTIRPVQKGRFTLKELLANTPSNAAVAGWDDSPAVGSERL